MKQKIHQLKVCLSRTVSFSQEFTIINQYNLSLAFMPLEVMASILLYLSCNPLTVAGDAFKGRIMHTTTLSAHRTALI